VLAIPGSSKAMCLEEDVPPGYDGGTVPTKEAPVISEIITFKLRRGMTREDVVAAYRKTAPIWRANPECIRKCYLYDGERGLGGGAYLWRSLEAAKLAHGDAWRKMINDLYGSEDQISITYFETPIVADNLVQRTIEEHDVPLSLPVFASEPPLPIARGA
jgi:hypothetical protein